MVTGKKEIPILSFSSPKEWAKWLSKNYENQDGVLIRLFKKGSGVESINHDQALEEALCYGWIDGQSKSLDEKSWLQKFTPRRTRSIWSKRNVEHIARLTKLGKMKPSGIAQVEAAKADGRWAHAYDSPGDYVVPTDFLKRLRKNKKAEAFYKTLNKANTYAIGWRLQTAKKPETRKKWMGRILEMLAKEEKFH